MKTLCDKLAFNVEQSKHRLSLALTNIFTDSATIASVASGVNIYPQEPLAAKFHFIAAGICLTVRAFNENAKTQLIPSLDPPERLNFLFKNKGGPQITSGILKVTSSLFSVPDLLSGQADKFRTFSVSVGTGAANLMRGFRFQFPEGSSIRKAFDFAGVAVPALVAMKFTPEAFPLLDTGYCATIGLTAKRAFEGSECRLPERSFAAMLLTNAAFYDSYTAWGLGLWGAGFVSQDLLKNEGGVYEAAAMSKDILGNSIRARAFQTLITHADMDTPPTDDMLFTTFVDNDKELRLEI